MGSSPSIVIESVVAFLKNVPPFQFLPASELTAIAREMTLEYFPKGTVILRAGWKASDSLYIVQKGGVKLALHTAVGKELVLDMRGEGDFFGLLSLLGRDVTRLDVTAVEDTLCYAVPAEAVQELSARHSEFADYLLRTSVTRYMDRSFSELRQQTRLMGDSEKLVYSLAVRDVVKQKPVLCPELASIQEAARMASAAHATCLFVVDAGGHAVGIVTDRDFAGRVVATGLSHDGPITQIMSSPVRMVETSQPVFTALLAMLSGDIHHVLVTEDGVPAGVLTHHDLMLLQGKSPLNVVRHLEQQNDIEGLARAHQRVSGILPLLMREGARASHITRVVAGINDRVMAKVLDIATAKLGPAPVPWCWVVLGSEGRSEQTFKTDQDNALIYANIDDEDRLASADSYFTALTNLASDALAQCGYPLCTGGYMASNPFWRQSLRAWQSYFEDWITGAKRKSVEDALIFFDMRPVAGDFSLFNGLAKYNRELLSTAGFFKSVLAFVSTEQKPPIGFFSKFVVARTGEHKDELDLKMLGTGPIVNAARLLALDHGIEHTNTVDRLSALATMEGQDQALLNDVRDAFEFLMLLRLECQLRQSHAEAEVSSYVKPDTLTNLQRSLLKEAFHTTTRLQAAIESKYRSAVWWQLGR